MKITLCVSLVFLFNLVTLHKILAKPVDESELTNYSYPYPENVLSTEGQNASYYTVTTIGATTSENGTSDEAKTSENSTSDQTTTSENNTSDGATTSGNGTSDQSTTSENGVSDQVTTVASVTIIADAEITTVSSIDVTTGNDTLTVTTIAIGTIDADENATQFNITEETTPLTPTQATPSSRVNLQVVVNPPTLQVQRGQTYELICTVYGADANTNIYWIQEEPERRYALTDTIDKYVTTSQVSLRARITIDDPSKIGKYTCLAQDVDGNSDSGILTMQEYIDYYHRPSEVTPPTHFGSNYLSISVPNLADGDYAEIQCTGAAPEDEGKIQWYFNNRLLNDEQPIYPRGKTLHIRPISRPYLGYYRCSIPDSHYVDANSLVTFNSQPVDAVHPVFTPASPLSIDEGANQLILSPTGYYLVQWTRIDGQGLPSGVYQNGNDLQITGARSDHSGTYYCELHKADGTHINIPYEIHVRHTHTHHPPTGGPPKISIHPQTIYLKEGQRMIIQYTIASSEPIHIDWHKYTDQGYQPLPSSFSVEPNRLVLHRATPDEAGTYQITVRNSHGEVRQELRVNVESRRHDRVREHHHQQEHAEITIEPSEVTIGPGEKATIACHVKGAQQYRVTWSKYAHDTSLPDYAYQQGNSVIIAPNADTPSEQMYFQCQVDVPGQAQPHIAHALVTVRGGNESNKKKKKRHS